ncbi:MFS transporter [Sphaerisporangium album]|nr:MFS transporter [Sphaerisporangium album]
MRRSGSLRHRRSRHRRIAVVCAGAVAAVAYDAAAVSRSLPAAGRLADPSVLSAVYLISAAVVLTISGRLADLLGRRRVLLAGLALFTLSSAVMIPAADTPMVVLARLAQSVGAATIAPATLGLLGVEFPAERHASGIGIWSAAATAGAAVGYIAGDWAWPTQPVLSAALGGIVLAGAITITPTHAGGSLRCANWPGTVLGAAGLSMLALGLMRGPYWGWLSPLTLASLGAGVAVAVLALLFAVPGSSRRGRPGHRTWRDPMWLRLGGACVLSGAALFPALVIATRYAAAVRADAELGGPVAMTPLWVAVLAGLVAAALIRRQGTGPVMYSGALAVVSACVWLLVADMRAATGLLWLPGAVTLGIGVGVLATGLVLAVIAWAPPGLVATAAGAGLSLVEFGAVLGLAVASPVLERSWQGMPLPDVSWTLVLCLVAAGAAGLIGLACRIGPGGAAGVGDNAGTLADSAAAPATAPQLLRVPAEVLTQLTVMAEGLIVASDALRQERRQQCPCHSPATSQPAEHRSIGAAAGPPPPEPDLDATTPFPRPLPRPSTMTGPQAQATTRRVDPYATHRHRQARPLSASPPHPSHTSPHAGVSTELTPGHQRFESAALALVSAVQSLLTAPLADQPPVKPRRRSDHSKPATSP